MTISNIQRKKIDEFLFSDVESWLNTLPRSEYQEIRDRAYLNWHRAGSGFGCLHQGGTGQMFAIMWYQNKIKPGSKEWRPKIIIEGILQALNI